MTIRSRITFTRRHALVFALTLALGAYAAAPSSAPSPFPDRVIVNWAADASTGFSVTWRTDTTVKQALAEIVVSEDGTGFIKKARRLSATTEAYETDRGAAHSHSVGFHDLTPDTLYLYRVGDGASWTEWSQIRTASAKPAPLTFLYFGDVQAGIYSTWSRVVRKAYSMAPEARFMVFAGDLINRNLLDHEWGEWHQAGGWINQMVPSFPSPGNHEYGRATDQGRKLTPNWRPQFTLPTNGVPGLEETNYYTDIQGLRMIALNSNLKQKEQAEWLDKLLANNPNRWTVVVFHHPIYSTKRGRDNAELRELWQPVFNKRGVDLVLEGHDHIYGRTNLQGRAVYVVSMSGAKLYDQPDAKAFVRTGEGMQFFQIVRIQDDTLRFETRTASGKLYDAFTLRKQAGKPNKLTNQIPPAPK